MVNQKNPLTAAILNLLIPGAGFLYLKKPKYIMITGILLIICTIISIVVIFIHESTYGSINSLKKMEYSLNQIAESTISTSKYVYESNIQNIFVSNGELTKSAAKMIRKDYDFLYIFFKNRFLYWPMVMFIISFAYLTFSIAKNNINKSEPHSIETSLNTNPLFCKYCGVKNQNDAKYCASCGKQIN